MERASVNGVELEFEVDGTGEPVLLIDMVLPDNLVPLVSDPALAGRYQFIRYHRRGWVGSTHTPGPVSIAEHASDAVGLLDHLGIRRAHVVGQSSGATIGAQLTLDHPDRVHSLALLELTFLRLPNGQAFLGGAGPVLDAYGSGDHATAVAMFVSAASGIEWSTCRALLDERIPGSVEQAVKDADTFFGIELPSMVEWSFTAEQAASINRPVLSVIGSNTGPVWTEIATFLRANLPYVEETTIEGVGHLLQLQDPHAVAVPVSEFLARNPMTD